MTTQKLNQGMVIIYTGGMGSSKTLSMVREAKKYYDKGFKIYSNFHVTFPFEWMSRDLLRQMLRGEFELENAVLLLDEIHQIADSRRAASKKNLNLSYLVNQSRKKSVRILGTTQFFTQLDIRLRLATAIEIRCSRKFYGTRCRVRNVICKQTAPEEFTPVKCKEFWGNPYFTLYDSEEAIYLGDIDIKDVKEEKITEKKAEQEKKKADREAIRAEKTKEKLNAIQEKINAMFKIPEKQE